MVLGGGVVVKVNVPGALAPPADVVTTTPTAPVPAGVTVVIWVSLLTVNEVAATPPNVTEVAPVKN